MSNMHRTQSVLLLLVCVSLGFGLFFPLFDRRTTAEASWWSSSYLYSKTLPITNPSNSYQMYLNVTYASGGNVNCSSHCQSDFDDLRFVDIDNSTVLDYYIKKKVDGSYCNLYVETSADVQTDARILMYYGNSLAASASNGTNTFLFFDDFSNGLTKWYYDSWNSDAIMVNTSVGNPAPSLRQDPDNSIPAVYRTYQDTRLRTASYSFGNGTIEYDLYMAGTVRILHQFGWRINALNWTKGYEWRLQIVSGTDGGFFKYLTSVTWGALGTAFPLATAATWYHVQINVSGSTFTTIVTPACGGATTRTVTDTTTTTPGYISSQLLGVLATASNYALTDNVIVRKYAATTPTWGTFGTERNGPAWVAKQAGWDRFSNSASFTTKSSGWNAFSDVASFKGQGDGWNDFSNQASYNSIDSGWNAFGNATGFQTTGEGWQSFGNVSSFLQIADGWNTFMTRNGTWIDESSGWNAFGNSGSWSLAEDGWNDLSNACSWSVVEHGWNNFTFKGWYWVDAGWNVFGDSAAWSVRTQGWNSFRNLTIGTSIDPYPDDNDTVIVHEFVFAAKVDSSFGEAMNVSWFKWTNGSWVQFGGTFTGVHNGTYCKDPGNSFNLYNHSYTYKVRATTWSGIVKEEVVTFKTALPSASSTITIGVIITVLLFTFWSVMLIFAEWKNDPFYGIVCGVIGFVIIPAFWYTVSMLEANIAFTAVWGFLNGYILIMNLAQAVNVAAGRDTNKPK